MDAAYLRSDTILKLKSLITRTPSRDNNPRVAPNARNEITPFVHILFACLAAYCRHLDGTSSKNVRPGLTNLPTMDAFCRNYRRLCLAPSPISRIHLVGSCDLSSICPILSKGAVWNQSKYNNNYQMKLLMTNAMKFQWVFVTVVHTHWNFEWIFAAHSE